MMKKILLMSIALLLLTACGSSGVDYNFRQGHEGLDIDFLDNTFSSSVYEDGPFFLGLVVENKGTTDVEGARIVVSTERDLIEDFDNVVYLDLTGRTMSFDQGEQKIETLELKTKRIPVTEEINSRIRVDICYPYRSFLSTPVCIESDYTHEYEEKPDECPPHSRSFTEGQGGPVVITGVLPKMVPSKNGVIPVFEISIEDYGRGSVINSANYEDACSSVQYGRENYGVVDVGNIYLGDDQLVCTKSVLKLERIPRGNEFYESNRAVIKCTGQEIAPREPYIENLRVDLTYGYKDHIEDFVTITKK
jgi:hypothetical protein